MITKIFLDMDGVLCDFVGGVCRLFEVDQHALEQAWGDAYDICVPLGVTPDELWSRIDAAGPTFWSNLEPYPWAKDLWFQCNIVGRTTILTSPSWHPSSLEGKLQWLNSHLADGQNPFRRYLFGPEKEMCAAPRHLLIDDRPEMCQRFRDAGGEAFLFPRPWNGAWSMHDPFPVANDMLREVVRTGRVP